MATNFEDVGSKLRAYRAKKGMSAEDAAARLGVSRAAVYRIEAGEVIKVETLERLASLLGLSASALMGSGVEYYTSATSYFERVLHLEETSDQVIAHFSPLSYLLTSDAYPKHLKRALVESMPSYVSDKRAYEAEIDAIIRVMEERKASRHKRHLSVVNFLNLLEIERWLRVGFLGRLDVSAEELARSRLAARAEIEHLIRAIEQEPMGVQIGLIQDTLPNAAFQLFRTQRAAYLGLSPFRLSGEMPNIQIGVAMLTTDREPVRAYETLVERLWTQAYKGRDAVAKLRSILQRSAIKPVTAKR